MEICGNIIQRINTELLGKITEEVSEFICLGNVVSFDDNYTDFKMKSRNQMD
jgi:hypothetical protein